uniref:Transposase Tc1-like domain-containing protein n=1 Tax=Oncorhynchus tshawytscha TaxID=74940 RepID=A0AAZ3S1H2_ONCTS
MEPRSCHTAQEGDAFCLLEMNTLWCEKLQINPRTTAKGLVKMLEETGTKVSISTVKQVLYQHNLKGRSARKKPLLLNRHEKARLRFATAHGDKDRTFWRMSSGLKKQK